MEIDRAVAGFFWVQIDFPQLAQRIGLDEMTLVVHVETVVDSMALQFCHESGHIDDCHDSRHYREE